MSLRQIIKIDEDKCNGCGDCVSGCPEGALQIIDGKARLVGQSLCDGLGACIGTCPQGAITFETTEAEDYDERKVLENIIPQGINTIKAHMHHLKSHKQTEYFNQAIKILREHNIDLPITRELDDGGHTGCSCPGAASQVFTQIKKQDGAQHTGTVPSELTHWPLQLHLISPTAPQYQNSDLLLAADCVAFSYGDFHQKMLKGKSLIIACPKLDSGQDIYINKLMALIEDAQVNTITVAIMEVPCCRGLLALTMQAANLGKRKVPIKQVIVSRDGNILEDSWI
ncbi:MAG: 4Fe-4S binding protein [Deltaproteobacteria bacterium]|nr:4Fe-4S binding protein [Deltaproteobacteria bacterium]